MASKVYKYGNRELRLTPAGNTWKIELKQKNLQWLTKHDWKNPDAPARARVVESWMDISGRGVSGETEDAALRRAKNQSMDYPASTEIQGKEHMRPGDKLVASRPGTPARFAVEDRFYFGKGRKERFADDYAAANRRVQGSSELRKYARIIMSDDWREGADHWKWVATAPTSEIVSWAKEIADSL